MPAESSHRFPLKNYNLDATLTSGQAFRWRRTPAGWEGIIAHQWVRLESTADAILASTAAPASDWNWLTEYLQLDLDLDAVITTFPQDAPMKCALSACRGLRLLRQDPWECLGSFILSSTKQIVQIQQNVALLAERFGSPMSVPPGYSPAFDFPSPAQVAAASEAELRACKIGYRAPYLLQTARQIVSGQTDLTALCHLPLDQARKQIMQLPGVGPKVADCVLLFAYGFQQAFPVDVWVLKALRQLYFAGRKVPPRRIERFARIHFGPWSGYAQQYLFHYMRVAARPSKGGNAPLAISPPDA